MTEPLRDASIGVILCCRDEERVISRRLRNLARTQWPPSTRGHRIVVVDDGSTDGTARAALECDATFPPGVRVECIANTQRAGKAGAIQSGLRRLDGCVDVVVLTDADVVHEPDAITRLVRALDLDNRLGMVSAAQVFRHELADDGTLDPLDKRSSGGLFDRLSSAVRRLEACFGRTFSVHGQLMAWRAELNLDATLCRAADDLDLMRQCRLRGRGVGWVSSARFHEVKPSSDIAAKDAGAESPRTVQALRRARAYLQFARDLDARAAPDRWTAWQWRAYRHAPELLLVACCAGTIAAFAVAAFAIAGSHSTLGTILGVALGALTLACLPRALWLVRVVLRAMAMERHSPQADRWSSAR